jgi:hypothetical protein
MQKIGKRKIETVRSLPDPAACQKPWKGSIALVTFRIAAERRKGGEQLRYSTRVCRFPVILPMIAGFATGSPDCPMTPRLRQGQRRMATFSLQVMRISHHSRRNRRVTAKINPVGVSQSSRRNRHWNRPRLQALQQDPCGRIRVRPPHLSSVAASVSTRGAATGSLRLVSLMGDTRYLCR